MKILVHYWGTPKTFLGSEQDKLFIIGGDTLMSYQHHAKLIESDTSSQT